MAAPIHPLVCDRVVFSFWWCGFLLVGTWHTLLRTVRSRCSSLATSSVETLERLYCLSPGVLQSVSRGNAIRFPALALVLQVLPVSILSRTPQVVSSLLGCRTIAPFLAVGCFVPARPFL